MNAKDFGVTIPVVIPDDLKLEECLENARQMAATYREWRRKNGFTQRAEIYTLDKSGRILGKHVI